jgi:hypothetical protein
MRARTPAETNFSARSLVMPTMRSYRAGNRSTRSVPMRIVLAIAALALTLVLAACAPERAHGDAAADASKARPTTADYRRYVRGNVQAFNSSSVTDWDAPDPQHVVVWTSPAEAYLLTLLGACFGLESASTILLSADGGIVRPGAAAVMVGAERCRIQLVEKLDARAIKADKLR